MAPLSRGAEGPCRLRPLVLLIAFAIAVPGLALGASPFPSIHSGPNANASASATSSPNPRSNVGFGPVAQTVDPFKYETNEPAPMGIADYGIVRTGVGAEYNTTDFLGTATIGSILTDNASPPYAREFTLQLNVNLLVTSQTHSYTYWIQDVADVNTSNRLIYFIDNIWNESAPQSSLAPASVSGNGNITTSGATTFYYYEASPFVPGNYVDLHYPAQVNFRVNSTESNGVPEVAFEYNDGVGWVTYDQVQFGSARGFTDHGFVVDGLSYNPYGTFYDAELILGGPGGGSTTTDVQSNLSLQLSYWNGFNYQRVIDAYDFGSNTAEGSKNVTASELYSSLNGTLSSELANGAGHLTELWDRSSVGIVNISMPVGSGELYINDTLYGPFSGGQANVTVAPGVYEFEVEKGGSLVASNVSTILAGSYSLIQFGPHYRVSLVENGLPSGRSWSVTLGGFTEAGTSSTLAFYEPSGSFVYTVAPIPGFVATPSRGTQNVTNANVTVIISWSEPTYGIRFVSQGLPSGLAWSATLGGYSATSSNSTILFFEPYGTYPFSIGEILGFSASPELGTINETGANGTQLITWRAEVFPVDFIESGLPPGISWMVVIQSAQGTIVGSENNSATYDQVDFTLMNGTYSYTMNTSAPTSVDPDHGTFLVTGGAMVVDVNITLAVYSGPEIQMTDGLILGAVGLAALGGAVIAIALLRHRRSGP
jgi:hypothetical protein